MSSCRFCKTPLVHVFADLASSPLANSFLEPDQLQRMERYFPLVVHVCSNCFLVQVEEFETPDGIFSEYSYFSSFSDSWLDHCRRYAEAMVPRCTLNGKSLVVEIASNDGYLLQYFVAAGIPVLGIEPAVNVAQAARAKGVPTETLFFGAATAQKLLADGKAADLIAANNVLAHVPDINDFVAGFKILLKPAGTLTVEFPHLLNLIEQSQFDTIYHEHFSYLMLSVVSRIFESHGLRVFDVEEIPTHGGSLRVYGCHADDGRHPTQARVADLLQREKRAGLLELQTYAGFQKRIERIKSDFLEFLISAWEQKKKVAAYGAPAKGNTLLNYCGVRREYVSFTVDRSPHKAGRFLPGSRIPIYLPERIKEERPDYLLILPWNLKAEIQEQTRYIREWGGQFVTVVPRVEIW
jgi:SAM-dependent methyltransferase